MKRPKIILGVPLPQSANWKGLSTKLLTHLAAFVR